MLQVSLLVLLGTSHGVPAPELCVQEPLFLQMGIRLNETQSQNLTALLLEVRKECLRASSSCLPVLEKLRLAVWPRVLAETNSSFSPWMPGSNLEPLSALTAQAHGESRAGTKMAFRNIVKAGGLATFANLQQVTTGFKQEFYPDLCNALRSKEVKHRSFAWVRDPISRFLSGYNEIEHRTRAAMQWPMFDPLAQLLKPYPVGSYDRAAAFFEEFLRSGIDVNEHMRSQLEFLQPLSGCSLPMDFIGKIERVEEDWAKLFALENETVPMFDTQLALNNHGDRDKPGMRTFLSSSAKRVRALCWLYLGDFAVFEYELPKECQEEPLQSAVATLRRVPFSGNPLTQVAVY